MAETSSPIPPTYKEMLQEIGRQLGLRKKIILWRVLIIIWPLLVMTVVIYLLYKFSLLSPESPSKYQTTIIFVTWLWFTLIYYFIMTVFFTIEKRIWIDSFFDQRNLDPKKSWHIAWKLFIPIVRLGWEIFWRFYLPWILAIVVIHVAALYILAIYDSIYLMLSPFVIFGEAGIVIFLLYYLKIKLQFTWFIFLDRYNKENFYYREVFEELGKLNQVSKTEVFKKSLVANIGADTSLAVSYMVIGAISEGLRQLGHTGGLLGSIFKVFSEEASKQVVSFGRIVSIYVLYRFARFTVYNEPQKINEYIYNL